MSAWEQWFYPLGKLFYNRGISQPKASHRGLPWPSGHVPQAPSSLTCSGQSAVLLTLQPNSLMFAVYGHSFTAGRWAPCGRRSSSLLFVDVSQIPRWCPGVKWMLKNFFWKKWGENWIFIGNSGTNTSYSSKLTLALSLLWPFCEWDALQLNIICHL